jgi:hypothetical protein
MTLVAASGSLPVIPVTPDPTNPSLYPAGNVQVERSGLRTTMLIGGATVGGLGAVAGISALARQALSHGMTRASLPWLAAFGGAALLGGATAALSFAIPPKTEHALHANIPSRDLAELVESRIPQNAKVVETVDGSFALINEPVRVHHSSGGSGSSRHHSSGSSHSSGGSSRPSYPSVPGGHTSSGDTGGSSSHYPSGGTSHGDSGSSHSSSGGNSTSNGNPSSDDF